MRTAGGDVTLDGWHRRCFPPAREPTRGPAPYAIGEYEALDRSADLACGRARRMLDEWCARLPEVAAAQVRERFADKRDIVHLGALLELYLHELGCAMGYGVDIDVGNDANGQRRPDLLLRSPSGRGFFVEATALTGDGVGDPVVNQRLDEIHDAVNAVIAPAFSVDLDITAHGAGTPSRKRITQAVQQFLDGLNPDDELAAIAAGKPRPTCVFAVGDWMLSLAADPLRPEHRDYPHHRVIGGRFSGVHSIDDLTPMRRKVNKKAGHYGELGKPYVVALLCAGTFVDDGDINKVLMGSTAYYRDEESRTLRPERQRDGVWMAPSGPINTRLSAVLTFRRLTATAICAVQPTLWLNPWATHPLTDLGPWRRMEFLETGAHLEHPATATVAEILSLPERWPYEETAAAT
jgi:hypothetical protein